MLWTVDFAPLNESPSEKEGKWRRCYFLRKTPPSLNESPSEKEGKFTARVIVFIGVFAPSMKVPPKRKGNNGCAAGAKVRPLPSMKVPPKRKGNQRSASAWWRLAYPQ